MEINVVDILVNIMTHLRTGESLNEIKQDSFVAYDKSEVGAAYSWLFSRFPELEKVGKLDKTTTSDPSHRVLHLAEKVLISRESYGYLLRLIYMGLLDTTQMEKIIERIMLQFNERLTIEKLKELVAEILFEEDSKHVPGYTPSLQGDEKIH